jgi:hypothetical protein
MNVIPGYDPESSDVASLMIANRKAHEQKTLGPGSSSGTTVFFRLSFAVSV